MIRQTSLKLIIFLLFYSICTQAQGTLQKLKFEEAEQAYLNNNYASAITLLEGLEKEGLKNPRVLHLKIMATSKVNVTSLSVEQITQFKKDVAYYLNNYDIEGLEDKYKEVYQVSKTANSYMYDEGRLCSTQGNKYYTEKNYVKALEWYLKADQFGFKDANMHSMLGYLYQKGEGVEKDYKKAIEWYTKAANHGDAIAQSNLGNMYQNGKGVEKDFNKAIDWYSKAADAGNIYSQKRLGFIYQYGKGIQQNSNKAIEWYTKAALQNDLEAMQSLTFIYLVHLKDYDNALLWNQKVIDHPKATDKEKGSAIRERAILYNNAGRYTEAIEQYNSSNYMMGIVDPILENKHRRYQLGAVYENLGDYKKAYSYFESIGNINYESNINFKMGLYNYEGKGTDKSFQKAYELWNISIDIKTQGTLVPFCKAVLLYSKRNQKEWGNEQSSVSVDLIKELIKETDGYVLKSINNFLKSNKINERFPQFTLDKEHFFSYLAKEHNIIFE